MRTVIVRKLGLRNWMCNAVTQDFKVLALVTDLPSKAEALSVGLAFAGDLFMGMSDNPLIGEYTKGISKGPAYFENLARRFGREKEPIGALKTDLENPLFAMLKGPITTSQMVNGLGHLAPKKPVDKSVPPVDKSLKSPINGTRKAVILTSFRDLGKALSGTVFEKR